MYFRRHVGYSAVLVPGDLLLRQRHTTCPSGRRQVQPAAAACSSMPRCTTRFLTYSEFFVATTPRSETLCNCKTPPSPIRCYRHPTLFIRPLSENKWRKSRLVAVMCMNGTIVLRSPLQTRRNKTFWGGRKIIYIFMSIVSQRNEIIHSCSFVKKSLLY